MKLTRIDLANNFPTHFSQIELLQHCTREYENVVDTSATPSCVQNITKTFMVEWKMSRRKEAFLSSAHNQKLLERRLLPTVQLPTEVTPKRQDPVLKPRKPFKGMVPILE